MMLGYWHRPEDTAHALAAGDWYKTGDLAYADDGGLHRGHTPSTSEPTRCRGQTRKDPEARTAQEMNVDTAREPGVLSVAEQQR